MGKKVKKIFKKVDPFTANVTDEVLGNMGLPNVSGKNAAAEASQKQAEQMAAIQQRDTDFQVANAEEQARAAALGIQLNADRNRANELAQEAQQVDQAKPEVEVATSDDEARARRKRFQSQSVGGTGGGGTSIRL